MYDYTRFYIAGVTDEVCQDKCMENYRALLGLSTYAGSFCYCWYDNGMLPNPLPSDIHGYSNKYRGTGEVSLSLNEADGNCYKFFEEIVNTETPTQTPTYTPTQKPTAKPTNYPTQKPTEVVTTVTGEFEYLGEGWCKDHKYDYFDYIRYSTAESCGDICPRSNGFRGFSTYVSSYCYCWYSNNQLPSVEDSTVLIYDSFSGEGTIDYVEVNGYSNCYKFNPNQFLVLSPSQEQGFTYCFVTDKKC